MSDTEVGTFRDFNETVQSNIAATTIEADAQQVTIIFSSTFLNSCTMVLNLLYFMITTVVTVWQILELLFDVELIVCQNSLPVVIDFRII